MEASSFELTLDAFANHLVQQVRLLYSALVREADGNEILSKPDQHGVGFGRMAHINRSTQKLNHVHDRAAAIMCSFRAACYYMQNDIASAVNLPVQIPTEGYLTRESRFKEILPRGDIMDFDAMGFSFGIMNLVIPHRRRP